MRPVVLASAFLGGMWALFSGIGWFRNYGVDRAQHVPQIANLSIALGTSYLAIALIGAFGIFSAATQRAPLVRIYAFLAAFATLVIIGTGLTRIVTHFVWKNDLIQECTSLTTDTQIVYYGFWGPITHDVISPTEAAAWCRDSWNHDSWAEIVAFLILSVLASLFTTFAFTFHRQLLDPTSPANASRAPSSQARVPGFPTHYNPPYNAPYNTGGYGGPAASGAPGGYGYDTYGYGAERDDTFVPPYDTKPPGYVGGDNDLTKKSKSEEEHEEIDVTNQHGP